MIVDTSNYNQVITESTIADYPTNAIIVYTTIDGDGGVMGQGDTLRCETLHTNRVVDRSDYLIGNGESKRINRFVICCPDETWTAEELRTMRRDGPWPHLVPGE